MGGQQITDIASWADTIRRELPETGPWHYVNIQFSDSSYVASRDCKPNACVVTAVAAQLAILADRSRPDTARARALKFVVHLIADLHQPLHAGELGDRSGNDVAVTLNGKPTNLHALWDAGLPAAFGQTTGDVVRQLNDEIRRRNDVVALSGGTFASWVGESHDIARDVVYRDLPASHEITPSYVERARPVIHERWLRAGVRLGAMLERALSGSAR